MAETNGSSVRIPWLSIIVAVTVSLIGLGSWSLRLETTKADRAEVQIVKDDIQKSLGRLEEGINHLIRLRMK